jgi:hypothetical protein
MYTVFVLVYLVIYLQYTEGSFTDGIVTSSRGDSAFFSSLAREIPASEVSDIVGKITVTSLLSYETR